MFSELIKNVNNSGRKVIPFRESETDRKDINYNSGDRFGVPARILKPKSRILLVKLATPPDATFLIRLNYDVTYCRRLRELVLVVHQVDCFTKFWSLSIVFILKTRRLVMKRLLW